MNPAIARAQAWTVDQLRRARELARRHPVRAALLLPALVLAYLLALLPFTPSISDLRKAKSEVPTVVLSADGVVLAEFRRLHREWVPLNKVARPVIDALISTEDHRFYSEPGVDLLALAELADLAMLEPQDGFDLIVGKVARCGYVPDALPHCVLELAPMRHCFAV